MPVPCHSKNGFSIGGLSSDSYKMFGSDPLLSKSNNNKTAEQRPHHQNGYANGIGYLNTSRRCNSASSTVENGKISNGSSLLMNGHGDDHDHDDDYCQEICMLLAYHVVFSKSKDITTSSSSSGVVWKFRPHRVKIDNEFSRTMRRTVAEISDRHATLFTSMVKTLNIRRDNVEEVFTSVVDDIFSDAETNWGRVVTVYALGGKIAEYLSANDMDDCLEGLADHIGSYVFDVIGDWIMKNGGWDGFVRFFPDRSEENRSWNGLMLTAGLVGAGIATLFALKT